MDGFYSIWSKPYMLSKNVDKNQKYEMSDYELLTLILSVLKWKQYNGKAYMFCDVAAREFLEAKCIDSLFDGFYMLEVDERINPKVYWAAGKLYALGMLERPMVMIDLDLIVWRNIDNLIKNTDIYGIHREQLRTEVYPDLEYFKFKEGFSLPDDYDREVLPLNTALLYIDDIDFVREYSDKAKEIMLSTEEDRENLKHMVFVEQRLLPILAKKADKKIDTMFDVGENITYQDYFTHVWGHKNILKYNIEEKEKFCKRIFDRIEKDFPEYYDLVKSLSV